MYFRFEKQNARRFRQAFILALFRGDFCPFSSLCGVQKQGGMQIPPCRFRGKRLFLGAKKAPISIAENRCSPLCYSVVATCTGAGAARPSPPWVYSLPAERCAIPPAHGREAGALTARMSIYSFGRFRDSGYSLIPNSLKHSFKSLWCSFISLIISSE